MPSEILHLTLGTARSNSDCAVVNKNSALVGLIFVSQYKICLFPSPIYFVPTLISKGKVCFLLLNQLPFLFLRQKWLSSNRCQQSSMLSKWSSHVIS